MEMNGQSVVGRIAHTLHAKQFLVFYAIGLFAIDFMAPLIAAWLGDPRPLSEVFAESGAGLDALVRDPTAAGIGLVAGGLLLLSWLRCGYIRSIAGHLHFSPAGPRQFLGMLGILLITQLVQLGLLSLQRAIVGADWAAVLISLLQLGVYLFLLYADYAVVLSGLDPFTALYRSWQTVRANLTASLLVLVAGTLLTLLIALLIDPALDGGLRDIVGLLVVRIVAIGAVAFITDVALIVVFVDSVERGAIPRGRRR